MKARKARKGLTAAAVLSLLVGGGAVMMLRQEETPERWLAFDGVTGNVYFVERASFSVPDSWVRIADGIKPASNGAMRVPLYTQGLYRAGVWW